MIDIQQRIKDKKAKKNKIGIWWDGLESGEVVRLVAKHGAAGLDLRAYGSHSEQDQELIDAIYDLEHKDEQKDTKVTVIT